MASEEPGWAGRRDTSVAIDRPAWPPPPRRGEKEAGAFIGLDVDKDFCEAGFAEVHSCWSGPRVRSTPDDLEATGGAGFAAGMVAEGWGDRRTRKMVLVGGFAAMVAIGVALVALRTADIRALPIFERAVAFFSS